ncbi:MAG: glucose-6-phosphate isomerase [Armatimonadota bacterium]|nr:glucose-6-phosphate isomerase [Armatimonadota bacterium]
MFEKLPIALRTDYLRPDVTDEMISARREQIELADHLLRSRKCRGAAFTGWLHPDGILNQEELVRIVETADRLRQESDVLLLIGIGGSYLGARAVIEALADEPERVAYAGTNISAAYHARLRAKLEGKRVAINVVSKSGTTIEPAIALRLMKDLASYNAERLIVVTADAKKGALRKLADEEGYESFVVPSDIGGRYSVLSAVGLLPIAYAGIDINKLREGAARCAELCRSTDPLSNPAYYYAVARNLLLEQGLVIELLAVFEPHLHYLAEWWKQLFGESHGKERTGVFPSSALYTTDLHSLGQYVQEGRRDLFETFIEIRDGGPALVVPHQEDDADQLNFIADKPNETERTLNYVNRVAYEATALAHRHGGVPNMTVVVEKLDAYALGALLYFFEIACAVGGIMLGVNPFDQPGVEAYKRNMSEILGRPGYTQRPLESGKARYVTF